MTSPNSTVQRATRLVIALFCATGLGTATSPVFATLTPPLPLATLVERADLIVLGEVRGASSHRLPEGQVVTEINVAVREVLAGPSPHAAISSVRVQWPGGVTEEGHAVAVAGTPRLQTGAVAVFFLRGAGDTFALVGLDQGVWTAEIQDSAAEQQDRSLILRPGSSASKSRTDGVPLASLRAQISRARASTAAPQGQRPTTVGTALPSPALRRVLPEPPTAPTPNTSQPPETTR